MREQTRDTWLRTRVARATDVGCCQESLDYRQHRELPRPKMVWQGAGARLMLTGCQLNACQVGLGLEELGPTFVKMG